MKVNRDKSLILTPGNKKVIASTDNNCIKFEDVHELLEITIDSKLTFENNTNKLCKMTNQNLNKRKIKKAFITSQFSYCSLV